MRNAIFIVCLFLLQACGQGPSAEQAAEAPSSLFAAKDTISEEELITKLSAAMSSDTSLRGKERNLIVNYLIDQKKDMAFTNSGLFYRILFPGEGAPLQWADYIKVNYRGYFLDGKEFDSSYKRGEPISFYIGNMVDGWNEGLQLLSPGAKATFVLPSHLGYAENGFTTGPDQYLVPPNTIIAFDIEVLEKLPDPNQ
ncbi:MAG: hypothetical protein F6K19_40335 [Cyanothece sp. SIO1E1]|nr:hypothetical protein [Cyanothece sp. SIO1E1]